jgi:hypothetical protein
MSHCGDCKHRQIGIRKNFRFDKSYLFPFFTDGQSKCCGPGLMNGKPVPDDFGCVDFSVGNKHEIVEEYPDKDPWDVWEWVQCPEHPPGNATVDGIEKRYGACTRCAGGGRVRKYGDGWEGDEQLQMHPAEVALRRSAIEADILAKARAEVERLTGITLPPEIFEKDKQLPFA